MRQRCLLPHLSTVRDSKRADVPQLTISGSAWATFLPGRAEVPVLKITFYCASASGRWVRRA
ncbi:DUF397 domain-containing protein [Streptomyces sp. NPDC087294]|uniref:DUF397 domain-containing protein n=1 Tax=Streptomyces sp. NPDC087294 TaxID=3365777 RepID=UPI003821644D